VSDPEESGPFSSERGSMLASLGARRRWFGLFRSNGANGTGAEPDDAGPESEEPFVAHSMLGDLASHATARVEPESVSEEPFVAHSMLGDLASHAPSRVEPEPSTPTRSLLGLRGPDAIPAAKPQAEEPTPVVFGHTGLHSTVGELAGLEEHPGTPFPIERFILLSLLAHLALVVLLIVVPTKIPTNSKGDLFAALVPQQPKDDSPIPVIFTDATGQPRSNPKRSPLSDADRRAGGGDPSKPKAATPYSPPSGIAGLAPGPRGPRSPRVPGSVQPARPGANAPAEAEQRAEASPSKDQKPSEFPNQNKPLAAGPREAKTLTGLDAAIREAARGAVGGGEGGSPVGDPEGGFVDSGPLSFDTTWYDWGPYAAEMVRRIKLHWDVPELARLGWKGSLTVRFFILADGTVADAKILRGSGIPPFDFAAFQAIVKSSPFRPLPADLHSTREGVTVTFFYNMRPESESAGGAK
jgi:TonB family protein